MIFRSTITILLVVTTALTLYSQYDIIPVFPDLEGDELFEAVITDYKPSTVLSLTQARDTIYKGIYLHQDSVRCIYTNLTKYLPDGVDPSQQMFEDGGNDDINLEHSFPRSKGASSGLGNSDMHHLFPSRVTVNSARGSDPFNEIPDNSTVNWYYDELTQNSIPTSNIDLYSEDTSSAFEPAESSKGNIARAQFYFYTMYKEDADNADPQFFELQKENLCQWHEADPVDSLEWVRTFKIAAHQNGRANPFILDCRLARMYCNDISSDCRTVHTKEVDANLFSLYSSQVRSGDQLILIYENQIDLTQIKIEFYNIAGQLIQSPYWSESSNQLKITAPESLGQYIIVVNLKGAIIFTKSFSTF